MSVSFRSKSTAPRPAAPSHSSIRFSFQTPLSRRSRCLLLSAILFVILILSLIFCGIYLVSPTDTASYRASLLEEMETARSFDAFTDALFCYETTTDSVTTAYTLATPSSYGIPDLEPRLTSFSYSGYSKAAASQSNQKILQFLSDSLKRFSNISLDKDDQVTYCLLKKNLELSKEETDYPFYEELLGSSTGVQANLPVTLGEYPLRTEEDVEVYLSLLEQVPAYFQDAISYENKRKELGLTTPDFLLFSTKNNLETLLKGFQNGDNSFIDTFNERISKIDGLSKNKKRIFEKRNEQCVKKYIIPAYEELYNYIKDTPDTGIDSSTAYGLSTKQMGTEYYSLLVQTSTGSSRPVSELITMTENALASALGDVLNIALMDQEAYLYYCENEMECCYQSPETILEALSLMMREDYPVLDNPPSYQIKTVSDSLASSLSPAFYMIPAIDDYRNNTIYINPLYTNEENGNIFTTLAHEGFPGHLYQTVYFNNTNPAPIRQALNYPGYVEGWATYVEMNSFSFLDYPLEGDSLCRLYQADTIINLALCSRIDLGVNYEGWTLKDVQKFFEDNGFNSYYAENVYSYVVEAPANYLSYFIGYLEIMDLKNAYKNQEMKNFTEKEFHKRFLDIGPADFDTLRKFLLE